MSSTSQKHRNFVVEPMGEKPVTDLAGVGEVLGARLENHGFDKAYVVLGQFLVLKKNKELFQDWMKDICQANAKQSADCFQCLSDCLVMSWKHTLIFGRYKKNHLIKIGTVKY